LLLATMVDSDNDSSSLGGEDSDSSISVGEPESSLEGQPADNPDTFEDFFEEIDDHWLTEDHLFDIQTARDDQLKVPPALNTCGLLASQYTRLVAGCFHS
jgi:hypothetical protein